MNLYLQSKATVLSAGPPNSGLWVFNTELAGNPIFTEPNNTGEGTAMAWRAGAELALMEKTAGQPLEDSVILCIMPGNAHNTWYPCNIVDANGKEVPGLTGMVEYWKQFQSAFVRRPDRNSLFLISLPVMSYRATHLYRSAREN